MVLGVLLAAGAGSRFGMPKALARSAGGTPWVVERVASLQEGGCSNVLVVLGAEADAARALLPPSVSWVFAPQWAEGLSFSLQEGLRGALRMEPAPAAALVALVDTPGLTAAAVRRLTELAIADGPSVLARACYGGQAGHPVLLGREHWGAAAASAVGDRGAGAYVKAMGAVLVECGDVADGGDVDVRPQGH